MRRWFGALALACAVFGFCSSAIAEEGAKEETAPSGTEAGGCFPKCREGYTCHQAQCVSLCNPACNDGEKCNADGQCVDVSAKSDEKKPAEPQAASTSASTQDSEKGSSPLNSGDAGAHSRAEKRTNSVAMVIVGGLSLSAGGLVMLTGHFPFGRSGTPEPVQRMAA